MSEGVSQEEQERLNHDISHLEGLIDELLTFARLDRPQVVLNLTAFDLPRWLGEKLHDVRTLHPERAIAQEIPAGGDFVSLDERLTERVLDNLVNNALRYSRHSISVRLGQQGDWRYLQVDDDGPVIPAAESERIFEPFVRLDPSRDRTTGGCGLGLAIVYSIALAYGGEVSADESHLGGARFLFLWPLKAGAARPSSVA